MMFCGYNIPRRAQKAGEAALAAQDQYVSSSTVARAVEPLIPDTNAAWKHATKWMAACATAEQLIFDAVRNGKIEPCQRLGSSTWRRKK